MAQVFLAYVGHCMDLRKVKDGLGRSVDFWNGSLHSALHIVGQDYDAMMRGKPRSTGIVGWPAEGLKSIPRSG